MGAARRSSQGIIGAVSAETPAARAAQLLDEAAERSRTTARERVRRLWSLAPAVVQTALASGVAWVVAHNLIGHARPFFAPISAVIVLGVTAGRHARRAVELAAGVSLGILVADLIVVGLGTGPLTIALVIALAMSAAILLGGEALLVSQAATSAALVATLAGPSHISFARAVDAAVGGSVALIVSLVLFPIDPVRLARRAAGPLLDELAAVLAALAAALEDRNRDEVIDVLGRARRLDDRMSRFRDAATVASEIATYAPLRRGSRPVVGRYATAARHVDNAQRNVRVLARDALRAVELDADVPPEAIRALRELAAAVRALAPSLDEPERADRARERAIRAAAAATLGLERTANLAASAIVAQIRSTATDLLRGLGMEGDEARQVVRGAAADMERAELEG
jgi:uncharacterized membrane protein YgaE (UPF0421/DUF939 family)